MGHRLPNAYGVDGEKPGNWFVDGGCSKSQLSDSLTLNAPPNSHYLEDGMRNEIRREIKRLSARAFDKNRFKSETEEKYRRKFHNRTGVMGAPAATRSFTYLNVHFDPTHCKRNANGIATAIWHNILNSRYDPQPALTYNIPKRDGGTRQIMAFSIPDAAVANVLMRRVLNRNKKKLSPHSFAYHPDKNLFDAILSLRDFSHDGKLFAVQIDFEKYFDNIPSSYIKKKVRDKTLLSLTPHERYLFDRFLHHRYGSRTDHAAVSFRRRVKGTPQGSSASLVLANLANHDLDRRLASEAGKFVRFADDVVAVCKTYDDAQKIEKCFNSHCIESGLLINANKSPGVSILSSKQQEIRTSLNFVYLGYNFTDKGLTIPINTVERLKSKISRLINIYLIQYLKYGFNQNRSSRLGNYDWDLLGLIYEIRRGLYGGLSEQAVSNYIRGGDGLPKMRGLMGFYCLIEDPGPLKDLDGWMVNAVRRACSERAKRLVLLPSQGCPTPNNRDLISGDWLDLSNWRSEDEGAAPPEVQFPSFVRGWRAARKHYFTFGLEGVQSPAYESSSDIALLFDIVGYR